jgi:hypothetical protein
MAVKKRVRKRKCLGCGELFVSDPRTRDRQRFCSKPECKRKSKAWRQRRWLKKRANQAYFSGPEHVERVQRWRKEHPGYSKEARLRKKTLQDDCEPQVVFTQEDTDRLMLDALQDDCESQVVLLVGLIANLTDCALQDDIASSIRKFHSRGQCVLAMRQNTKKGDGYEDQKTVVTPRAGASSP